MKVDISLFCTWVIRSHLNRVYTMCQPIVETHASPATRTCEHTHIITEVLHYVRHIYFRITNTVAVANNTKPYTPNAFATKTTTTTILDDIIKEPQQ